MSNILEELAQSNRQIINERKKIKSLEEIRKEAETFSGNHPSFKDALQQSDIAFICELKKASPSKGLINPEFPYLDILNEYENNNVQAISCLTEPTRFLGSLDILKDVTSNTSLPVLRKDFITEPYQIYEARLANASALLLIVALLETKELKELLSLTKELGMDALVEVHNKKEIEKALEAGAEIIGINNRDLRDFSVDLNTSLNLAKYLPKEVIRISESGIHSGKDVLILSENNFNGILIGEQLMASKNIKDSLKELRSNK